MQFKVIHPPEALKPFVKNFWFLDVEENNIPFSHHLLPYGWFELFFYLSDVPQIDVQGSSNFSASHHSTFIGQLTQSIRINYLQSFRAVGVSLQAWAGNALFGIPANELANQSIPLDYVDKNTRVRAHLLNAKNDAEIISLLEEYLYQKLREYRVDAISATISNAIMAEPGSDHNYKNILLDIGYSRRRIEQKFLAATGTHMGAFLRYARFEKAIQTIEKNEDLSLTQIGLKAGFYDQAHFSREFKKLSSITPKKYKANIAKMNEMERKFHTGQ